MQQSISPHLSPFSRLLFRALVLRSSRSVCHKTLAWTPCEKHRAGSALMKAEAHLPVWGQGSDCPPSPIPTPPPSIILGSHPGGWEGQSSRKSDCPCPWRLTILFSSPSILDSKGTQEGAVDVRELLPCLSPTLLLQQVVPGTSRISPHPGHLVHTLSTYPLLPNLHQQWRPALPKKMPPECWFLDQCPTPGGTHHHGRSHSPI